MRESDEIGGDEVETPERTKRIRALNDGLRQTFAGGRVLMTRGVQDLPKAILAKALWAIQHFDAFEDANDPYREHDFGAVEIEGHKVWFKMDYYDLDCRYGSPDPSDPAVTTRVMTILLPEEY